QREWLEGDLRAARATHQVILVGMHKPLANNPVTTHAMDEDGPAAVRDSEAVLALLQRFRVAMVFVSHSHMSAAYGRAGVPVGLPGGLGAPLVSGLSRAGGGFHHFLLVDVPLNTGTAIRVEVVRFPALPGRSARDNRDEREEIEE